MLPFLFFSWSKYRFFFTDRGKARLSFCPFFFSTFYRPSERRVNELFLVLLLAIFVVMRWPLLLRHIFILLKAWLSFLNDWCFSFLGPALAPSLQYVRRTA